MLPPATLDATLRTTPYTKASTLTASDGFTVNNPVSCDHSHNQADRQTPGRRYLRGRLALRVGTTGGAPRGPGVPGPHAAQGALFCAVVRRVSGARPAPPALRCKLFSLLPPPIIATVYYMRHGMQPRECNTRYLGREVGAALQRWQAARPAGVGAQDDVIQMPNWSRQGVNQPTQKRCNTNTI